MSWAQVYISGLSRSIDPSDKEIENLLVARYNLTEERESDDNDAIVIPVLWAGPDTTLVKRDDDGSCRGFAFLTFYSAEGASIAVDRINSSYCNNNNKTNSNNSDNSNIEGRTEQLPLQLRAELSNPKAAKEKKKTMGQKDESKYVPDLRLRRQRKQPIRKHPVIISSNGKKTNLGNKTR